MSKKVENQWMTDRAFNIGESQSNRLKEMMIILNGVSNNNLDYTNALNIMEYKGLVKADRYEQSTQTLLKKWGLIKAKDKISQTGVIFSKELINIKELLLLQLFKMEHTVNNEDFVRVLVVTLMVLTKLREIDRELSWIDEYDYFNFLIKITSYDDIDSFVSNISLEKKDKTLIRKTDNIHDFDIWSNAFIESGLFIKADKGRYSFRLNEEEEELIRCIIENHDKSKMAKGNDYIEYLTNPLRGFVEILDDLTINEDKQFEVSGFLLDSINRVIIDNLVFNKSNRISEQEIFNFDDYSLKGHIPNAILKSLGISSNNKGKYSFLSGYQNIILLKNVEYYHKYLGSLKEDKLVYSEEISKVNKTDSKDIFGGENLIIFGTPGSGKSYFLDNIILDSINFPNRELISRTIFHTDYSNSDFIGQIMPKLIKEDDTNHITYEFKPGPFTLALENALKNKDKKVVLLIDELNRGNASAIFGEVFQLLDRNTQGESVYSIYNHDISNYLSESLGEDILNIKIPSNLWIYATMNTSDQNVYSLDSAFKRRWNYYKMKNTFDDYTDILGYNHSHDYKDHYVPGLEEVTWEKFVSIINEAIIGNEGERDNIMNISDKMLGIYFVDEKLLVQKQRKEEIYNEDKINKFAYKVFSYLWEDVAKFDKDQLFRNGIKTFDELLLDYAVSKPIFNESITSVFTSSDKDHIESELLEQKNED